MLNFLTSKLSTHMVGQSGWPLFSFSHFSTVSKTFIFDWMWKLFSFTAARYSISSILVPTQCTLADTHEDYMSFGSLCCSIDLAKCIRSSLERSKKSNLPSKSTTKVMKCKIKCSPGSELKWFSSTLFVLINFFFTTTKVESQWAANKWNWKYPKNNKSFTSSRSQPSRSWLRSSRAFKIFIFIGHHRASLCVDSIFSVILAIAPRSLISQQSTASLSASTHKHSCCWITSFDQ